MQFARMVREALGVPRDHPVVDTLRTWFDRTYEKIYSEGRELRLDGIDAAFLINSSIRSYSNNYEPGVARFLAKYVKPDTVFADVGANVGIFSMYVAKKLGEHPSGHVYAFEPTPSVIEALEGHLKLNSLAERITVCPFAVADEAGVEKFQAPSNNRTCAGLVADTGMRFRQASTFEVRTVTLDDFFDRQRHRPTMMKIDVEGSEARVLKGASGLLSTSVDTVIIETHPHLWVNKDETRAQLVEAIQRFGFQVTHMEQGNNAFFEKGHLLLQRPEKAG